MAIATSVEPARHVERARISGRELEILSVIAQGHSSKEVAELLSISKRTVDFHLSSVYEKLHVSNRVQAIYAAGRLGLLKGEPEFSVFRAFKEAVDGGSRE